MENCPYHLKTDRAACTGAGRTYLPSLGEIEGYCCGGGHRSCPVFVGGADAKMRPFPGERYWLLGPSCPA